MKKAYQIPAMKVVNMQSERIVCQSGVRNVQTDADLIKGGAAPSDKHARGREYIETDWEEWE